MKMSQNINAALPIVAQSWGNKIGVKVVVGGSTAYTDGKTIVVPHVSESFGSLEPLWGFLLHEAQHVKHTNFGVERKGAFFSSLVNILEDVRIERDCVSQYPGAKKMLDACATYMVKQNHYHHPTAEEHPAQIIAAFCLFYGQLVGVHQDFLKGLLDSATKALRAVAPSIEAPLVTILDEAILKMDSTQSAADYSRKIMVLIQNLINEQQQQQQQQQQQNDSSDGEGDDQGESQGGDSSDGEGDDQGESQGGDSSDGEGDDQGESQGGDSSDGEGDDQGESQGGDSSDGEGDDQGESQGGDSSDGEGDDQGESQGGGNSPGDSSGKDQNSKPSDDTNQQVGNPEQEQNLKDALCAVLDECLQDVRDRLKRDLYAQHQHNQLTLAEDSTADYEPCKGTGFVRYNRAMRDSAALRRQFSGLLQSEQHTDDTRSRRGKLGRNLSKVIQGETKLFIRKGVKVDTGAAVHILVDSSGSMGNGYDGVELIDTAVEAAAAMFAALEPMPNTSVGLSFFDSYLTKAIKHGERLAAKKDMLGMLPRGGTETGQSILSCIAALLDCKQQKKILFVITDGQPNCAVNLAVSLDLAKKYGIDVYGIGIKLPQVTALFENSVVITKPSDLRSKLLSLTRQAL